MTFSPRPHPGHCSCEECSAWARAVVATPTERRPTPAPSCLDRAEMPMESFMRGIIAAACRATGLTEEQLRARGKEIESEIPAIPVERASRETVLARGVPEVHVRHVYDSEPVEYEALLETKAFASSSKTVLVLAGGVGTCKTGSASWALTQKPGVFVTADEAVRLSTSNAPEDVESWRRVRNAQLLVIDDMGGEYAGEKGWNVRVFNGLLDQRYSRGLKTIITTNLTSDRFKADYGERVVDRIREAGKWVTLGGTSVRKQLGAA